MVKEFIENSGVRTYVAISLIIAAIGLGYRQASWEHNIERQIEANRQRFVSKSKFRRWIREARQQNRSMVFPDLKEDEED